MIERITRSSRGCRWSGSRSGCWRTRLELERLTGRLVALHGLLALIPATHMVAQSSKTHSPEKRGNKRKKKERTTRDIGPARHTPPEHDGLPIARVAGANASVCPRTPTNPPVEGLSTGYRPCYPAPAPPPRSARAAPLDSSAKSSASPAGKASRKAGQGALHLEHASNPRRGPEPEVGVRVRLGDEPREKPRVRGG